MKKTVLIILLIITITSLKAQYSGNHMLELSGGFSIGNYYGGGLSLSYINPNGVILQLKYTNQLKKSTNLPEDYDKGVLAAIFFESVVPHDKIDAFHFLAGKKLGSILHENIRLRLMGGLGFSIIQHPYNWEEDFSLYFSPNYTFEYHKTYAFSSIVNLELEYSTSNHFGYAIAPFVSLNKEKITYGGEFKITFRFLKR